MQTCITITYFQTFFNTYFKIKIFKYCVSDRVKVLILDSLYLLVCIVMHSILVIINKFIHKTENYLYGIGKKKSIIK